MDGIKESRMLAMTPDTMNPCFKNVHYAVLGSFVKRTIELELELKNGVAKPFSELILCYAGNCHAMGQPPISFLRQVMALVTDPSLLHSEKYPLDARQRSKRIMDSCIGLELYSPVLGLPVVREDCANYIETRDGGVPSRAEDILLCTGASEALREILEVYLNLQTGELPTGVMIPIPQYPLYQASISQYNLTPVPYFLDEADNWSLSLTELNRAFDGAIANCIPRLLVVINPGNPTGQVLRRESIEEVIRFARDKRLLIMADEVYQHNVYAEGAKFYSFKQVLHSMGDAYFSQVELASLMSSSKGYAGECGFRGGYCELLNVELSMTSLLYKQLSNRLCPSVMGQAMLDVIVNPPQPGEPSFELFEQEKQRVLGDLALKARMATETFNGIDGMQCNPVQGAMYAFPRIDLPGRLIDEAKEKGVEADVMYCNALLEEKGVCVVPGSGFGQKHGTHHFRMTILPPVGKLQKVMALFKEFHESYVNRWM